MSDQQIDDILEHFGIKGMRWGVRNQKSLDRVSRVARGTELKKRNQNRLVKGLAVGGAIGATAVISTLLARKGMISMSEANRMANARASQHLMSIHGKVKMAKVHDIGALRGLKDFASRV